MNRYSYEQFTRRLLPGLRPCVAGLYWTAIVPDEPYRAKGLCGGTKFPPHLAHSPLPPPAHPPQLVDKALNIGAIFANSTCSPRSSLASSASNVLVLGSMPLCGPPLLVGESGQPMDAGLCTTVMVTLGRSV